MRIWAGAAAILASALIVASATAQEAEGYWRGTLPVGATELAVGVAIARRDNGALSGTLDSPDQNAFGIPLADVVTGGGRLSFSVPTVGATFTGAWDEAARGWKGTFRQGGAEMPVVLVPSEPFARAKAPSLPVSWEMPSDAAIAELIARRVADRPGAGMVVALVDGSNTRTVSGGSAGADDRTIFEIGSMTKVFTSLLLAQMALDGTVRLDDPVAKYLPAGAVVPQHGGKQITLRNLSLQDSGLPRLPDNLRPADPANPYADFAEQDLLAFLAGYRLTRDPGDRYEYSNLGVGLLGYALARAAGSDFETLLQTRILRPLGMADTGIVVAAAQQARFARGHDEYMRPTSAWDLSVLAAAGGMRSTASDMVKFLRAAIDPASPIGPAMRLALAQSREAPGFKAGLGWMLIAAPSGAVAGHGGGTGGFRSYMAVQRETGRGVVVLTNAAAEPSAQDIALHALIGAPVAKTGPVPPAPKNVVRQTIELAPDQLDRVTGTYRFNPQLALTVTREGNQLHAAITGQGALPIFPRTPLEFFWRAVNAEVVFTERDGKVVGATFTQDGASSVLTREE